VALNYVKRYAAHNTHHTAHLKTAENLAAPAIVGPPLTFAKRQVIDAIHLQVVRPIVAGRAAIPLFLRQVLNSRTAIVIRKVDRLGPRVSGSKERAGPSSRE